MTYYLALIHKDQDSDYGVMFPDFPGCISAGRTFEEAVAMGSEALSAHVEVMRADRAPIPRPRSLAEIQNAGEDWVDWQGAVIAMIPLLPPAGRSVRVNITLDERLLAQIDAATTNRSGFLAEAARRALMGG